MLRFLSIFLVMLSLSLPHGAAGMATGEAHTHGTLPAEMHIADCSANHDALAGPALCCEVIAEHCVTGIVAPAPSAGDAVPEITSRVVGPIANLLAGLSPAAEPPPPRV